MRTLIVMIALVAGALPLAGKESEVVTVVPREGGWAISELLFFVTEQTGQSISFEPDTLGDRKIEFEGVMKVPTNRFFEWSQSLLSFYRLILVPTEVGKTSVWRVLQVSEVRRCRLSPDVKPVPPTKNEEDVQLLLCVRLNHVDPQTMSEILGDLTRCNSTPIGEKRTLLLYGRREDLGHHIELIRALDVPSQATLREIERLERLLSEVATDEAAIRIVERIRALRSGAAR